MNIAVIDTNIYIGLWTKELYKQELSSTKNSFLIRQSSVVLHELRRSAVSFKAQKYVFELYKISPKILVPTVKHWWLAAKFLKDIKEKYGFDLKKITNLQNDILIALTALDEGAYVITNNKKDFELIKNEIKFKTIYF